MYTLYIYIYISIHTEIYIYIYTYQEDRERWAGKEKEYNHNDAKVQQKLYSFQPCPPSPLKMLSALASACKESKDARQTSARQGWRLQLGL